MVIVDRRDFDRFALELLCAQQPDLAVVASVATIDDAALALAGLPACTVLLGRQLVIAGGDESVNRLRTAGAARIILVGTGNPERLRTEALRMGADGVLQRDGDTLAQLSTLTAAA